MLTARQLWRYAGIPALTDWTGDTVVCIASGPSLTQEDVDYCRGKARVLVINDNYRLALWADMLYAGDKRWWDYHWDKVRDLPCHKVSQDSNGKTGKIQHDVFVFHGIPGYTLSTEQGTLHWGGNSGFQAIQVAYQLGCRKVLLLGYDMCLGPNGEKHWFGDHPHGTGLNQSSPYEMFRQGYKVAAAQAPQIGLALINCSRETAIKEIPRAALRKVLK